MGEYLLIVRAVLGHDVRAVLAHADAVAVARDGEEEALGGVVEREGSGAQLEESAQLRARHLRAAYIDALDPAGGVVYRRAQPEGGVLPELGLGVGGEHRLAEVLRGDGDELT